MYGSGASRWDVADLLVELLAFPHAREESGQDDQLVRLRDEGARRIRACSSGSRYVQGSTVDSARRRLVAFLMRFFTATTGEGSVACGDVGGGDGTD
jgi:hypothetical protein